MSKFVLSNRISEKPKRNPVFDGVNSTDRHEWTIVADTELNAYALLSASAGLTSIVDFVPLESRTLSLQESKTINSTYKRYIGIADYKHVQRDEQRGEELVLEDDERVQFQFSMPNSFFMFAKEQDRYPMPEAPDVGLAINVEANGKVSGVDISTGNDPFSVTRVFPAGTVTNAWIAARRALLGHTNNSTFRGFDIGEVLAVSFSGNSLVDGRAEITFNFDTRPNEMVSDIGGVDLGSSVEVQGFDYAWVMNRPTTDDNDSIVPDPIGAYVARLFDQTNFSSFGVDV